MRVPSFHMVSEEVCRTQRLPSPQSASGFQDYSVNMWPIIPRSQLASVNCQTAGSSMHR